MHRFEIESIEGIGYLLFERKNNQRTRRIGEIFKSIQQAREFVAPKQYDNVELIYRCSFQETTNGKEINYGWTMPTN